MGDVVGGLFGDEPDYVGDNIEAQKRSLSEAMEKGRTLADSQYARNLRAAYDTAALNRYNQITPYGSLTWYNTNDPQEAQRLAEESRMNSFVNDLIGNRSNVDLGTISNAASQFLGSDPAAARAAMNAIHNGSLMEQAASVYNNQVADRNAQVAAMQGNIDNIDLTTRNLLNSGFFSFLDNKAKQSYADRYKVPVDVFNKGILDANKLVDKIPTTQEALAQYNKNYQNQNAAYQKAVREYQQPNGDLGVGTMRQFKDPTV